MGDNPFDLDDDNPFQTPAAPPSASRSNPFVSRIDADDGTHGTAAASSSSGGGGGGGGGTVSGGTANPFGASSGTSVAAGVGASAKAAASNLGSAAEQLLREKELAALEERLNAKERELDLREARLPSPPNFPPCFPMVFHDIKKEIPVEKQTFAWQGYISVYLFTFTLFFNVVALLVVLFSPVQVDEIGWDVSMAVVAAIIGPTWIFFTWYRAFYYLLKNSRASVYWFFFAAIIVHLAACIMFMIGVSYTGGAGIALAMNLWKEDQTAGIFCVICSTLFLINALWTIYLFVFTVRLYRNSGLSFEQARNEAATDFAKSGAGQAVIKQGVKASVAGKA